MFNFLKKCTQRVYEIPEPLTVRERAIKVFSDIEGLDDIKDLLVQNHYSCHRLRISCDPKSTLQKEIGKSHVLIQIKK